MTWRHVPNAISLARLLATPVLLWALLTHQTTLFTWLLFACLISDILDGLIARVFRVRSALGARLDSAADMIVLFLGVAGIVAFQRAFLTSHAPAIIALLGLYASEVAAAMWRYGKISSFHTILARVAAYAQGIFVMSLFFWGYQPWIFGAMAGLTVLSLTEEILLVCLLPEWRADVRGLYWVRQTSR